jgi:hypothetical protein
MNEKYTWIKNNIRSLVAMACTAVWASICHYAVVHGIKDSTTVNSVCNIEIMVLTYYFGSSKTNEAKDIQQQVKP